MSLVFPVQSEAASSCSYTCTCVLLRQRALLSTFVLREKGRCPRALPSELTKYAGRQSASMSCRGDTALRCPRLEWSEQQHNECGHALANMFVERVKVQCAVRVCVCVCLLLVRKQGIYSDLECMFYNELRWGHPQHCFTVGKRKIEFIVYLLRSVPTAQTAKESHLNISTIKVEHDGGIKTFLIPFLT